MNTNNPNPGRLPRREAIKWMLAAGTTLSLLDWRGLAAPVPVAKGYGGDPNLLETYNPGDLWPLTLSEAQRQTATALGDVIIPAEGKSPAASAVHVVDFIDEWISAPYEEQQGHREIIVPGLDWLGEESNRRFKKNFAALTLDQQHALCDDIYDVAVAKDEFRQAALFFAVFRNLTAAGFYTTKPGWDEIGYVGNVPLQQFDGPPPEVLKHLGLM
jgi:hypothetical protein